MKRILAFLCVLAMMLSVVPATAFAAQQDLQAIIDAGAEEIIVLEADASDITIDRDTTIDLNGYNIDGVSVTGGTLYCMDSQTADYTVADGVYGQVTNVTGSVKAAEGYLQIGNSFHAVDLDIYAMTLRAADVGVYYKSNFAADEIVAAQVESFGVALSVVAAPNADNLDTYCGYSEFTGFEAGEGANAVGTSTLLKGIMKAANGDNKNAKNAAMPIYGSAYIKTSEGYFFGETVKRSLQEQVEAIDGVWAKLTDAQQAPVLAMVEAYGSVMSAWNIPNIMGGEASEGGSDVEIEVPVTAENGIVTEATTVEQGAISITVPAGTKLAEGVTQLTLTVTEKETSEAGLTLDKSEVLMPMDVHVEGLAADNTAPLTIYLGKVMAENLNMGNYTVYHVENGKANEMTLIGVNEAFTANNQYKYTLDGELTLYVATFSEFALLSNEENKWNGNRTYDWYKDPDADTFYIRNADQLAGFGAVVGGMDGQEQNSFVGKTITLLADISIGDITDEDGRDVVFYPIGYYNSEGTYEKSGTKITSGFKTFEGVFDGNGNTISDFYQNTWEMKGDNEYYPASEQRYRDGMGLFGRVYGGTVKNLTVRNFQSDGEYTTTGTIAAYADFGASFENISIFNCNPRVYNIGNGGIVGCVGWYTKAVTETPVTFKNITVDNTNKISALWGSYDVACGGIVGQYYPTSGQESAGKPANAGIHLENCHVAAQMDVYNDVCGNYMYYAYRYAGMLIGSIRENVTGEDGRVYPKMDGITANACTVHYGQWNHYYYCEFVKNGHPSYAAADEYKFSRVPESELVRNDAGKVIGCTHNHTEVENNRAVYLPFYDQLVTGYGWGVTSKGIADIKGVTVLDRVDADSVEKFEPVEEVETEYFSGAVLTVGDLFKLAEDAGVALDADNVQVAVSPADKESTAFGAYTADTADWTKGTLKLSGVGNAIITITDYYYCQTTTLRINVKPVATIAEVGYESVQAALNAAQDGNTIKLQTDAYVSKYLDVFTENMGETERSITLDLNGNTIAPAADYKYQWYPLVFVGINQTLTIKNGSIISDEYTAIGVYGTLNLETVTVDGSAAKETSVCIWNWGEDDTYYEDCPYQLTGSATIKNSSIAGGILVEGPVTLEVGTTIDKLYLNTKTGRGKLTLPTGYGMINNGSYYTDLHKHVFKSNVCTQIGCGLTAYYVKTDLAEIKSTDIVVITMTNGTETWALTNEEGAQETLAAAIITVAEGKVTTDIAEGLQWHINNTDGKLTIYPNGDNTQYLYCIDSNRGVFVGNTTQSGGYNEFVIKAGYLFNLGRERYLGVYESTDWRSYKPDPTVDKNNSNIANQTLAFYVLKTSCDHEFAAERDAVAPTCTVAGHEAGRYCSDCDTYINGGELINARGHAWGEWTTTKEATCTEDGKRVARCATCNKTTTETLKAGHKEVAIGEAVEATCTTPGITAGVKCSVCNEVIENQEEIPATGHNYEGETTTDATCGQPGEMTYTCSNCDDSYTEAVEKLEHNYVEKVTTEPGCTTTGVMTYICSVCTDSYTEEIAATGHKNVQNVPATDATCQNVGYTAGEFCNDCKTYISGHEEQQKADHNYVDYVCKWCGSVDPNKPEDGVKAWVLVTDASTLKAGDQVIIAAKDYNYALSTTQNTNNRGQTVITKNGNTLADPSATVQILTLKAGTKSGTFAFYTGSGYLYAASNSSNHLKTQETMNDNGSWSITIASDGTATIKAQGTNSHNWLRYNSTNNPPIFSAYASGQADVVIYKLTTVGGSEEPHEHQYQTEVTAPTCIAAGYTTYTCACGHSYTSNEVSATGKHNYEDGTCSVCGAEEPDVGNTEPTVVATFALGLDGTASHNEGTKNSKYSETDGDYELSLTSSDGYMYTGARDAKGNGCIKLGKSGTAGSFTFTVPADVTAVKIYIAKYKTNTSKVTINGTTYTLSNNSDSGEYDVITIDTTNTKTIKLATVSGGVRAMVNTIEFIAPKQQ